MMSEDSSAAGTDNHPPMLEENDYESWKIRIERYIKGKTHVPLAEPLALSTTNMFQVSHEDAYDSDVDDEPNVAAAFMANLSSSS
ncbi:hypothetical protein Tco_1367069, partial [Tanacetum coccineum]